ncbi:hypothetical protein D3C80_1358200 [compost metagenome]
MNTSSYQASEVSHVHQVGSSDFVCNFTHAGEIDLSRIRRATRDDQLRLVFQGKRFDIVIINTASFAINTIRNDAEPPA